MLLSLLLLATAVQGHCWPMVCPKGVPKEWELPASFEVKEWGGCFEGNYNYRDKEATEVGSGPEPLILALLVQFLGKLLCLLTREYHHVWCKPTSWMPRAPYEEQNLKGYIQPVSPWLPAACWMCDQGQISSYPLWAFSVVKWGGKIIYLPRLWELWKYIKCAWHCRSD